MNETLLALAILAGLGAFMYWRHSKNRKAPRGKGAGNRPTTPDDNQ